MAGKLADNIIPQDDEKRIQALRDYDILYTSAEEAFDNITEMMAQVFDTPLSFISLVDQDTVFYKSQVGNFGRDQVKRNDSLCSYTILQDEPLVIEDTTLVDQLKENPFVKSGGLRFYAGAPLVTKDGSKIGTACVVDTVPRTVTDKEKRLLTHFARMVVHEIELRNAVFKQAETEELLVSSNNELLFVTDTMPQLVWATEPDGYTFFFNKGWMEYTGLPFETIKGSGWAQSIHPEDKEVALERWNQALVTAGNYDVEYRLRRHDGEYRWFVSRGMPMRDKSGTVIKWYGTTTDIHEQKIVQQHLRQYTDRFLLVSKATQDAIWDWNLKSNEVWWNEGFKEMFGFTDEEIEPDSTSWTSRIHPDDHERVVHGIHDVIHGGLSQWSDQYRFRKKDGSYATVFDRGHVLYDQDGAPERMLGSMQDMTQRNEADQAIRESEERFEAAVIAVQGILWTNNAKGEMQGNQPGWESLTGQRYEEYQGFGWSAAVHPDDAQPTIDTWLEAVRERKLFIFEHRVKRNDGTWGQFSVRAVPLLNEDGTIREWVGVHTDITEKREAELKIRESEQRFQNLVREATVGIIVLMGEEMEVAVVNDSYGKLIGRKVDEMLHRRLFDIIPETEKDFRSLIDGVRISGEPVYLYDQFYSVHASDGEISGYLNLVYQPYKEIDGTITGVMVLCQDVTAQVQSKKEVEEAQQTAKMAVTLAELGTFNINLDTDEMIVSDRLNEIFDVKGPASRDQYVKAIHPEDQQLRTEAYQRAFENGTLSYEARILRKNGPLRWVRIRGTLFFDDRHHPFKIVGVAQDITEEKTFAEELTRQVKERTAEMEQFTYVSHHDLQEPLRKITMFSDMIRSESYERLTDSSKNWLNKVNAAAIRMSAALRDVLNFASLNKEELATEVDLNEILNLVETDLELVIAEKKAIIKNDPLPKIIAVPQQMHQLFYNLMNNALKFSKKDHRPELQIHCKTLAPGDISHYPELALNEQYYQLSFIDNGIGFNSKASQKIFVLFQRLHHREAYPGTGIGLALCKKVAANHGGLIWAESRENEGSTFHVILPFNFSSSD